jgi:hypothetical protein
MYPPRASRILVAILGSFQLNSAAQRVKTLKSFMALR